VVLAQNGAQHIDDGLAVIGDQDLLTRHRTAPPWPRMVTLPVPTPHAGLITTLDPGAVKVNQLLPMGR
jgi:hypothetical protein